MNKNLYKINIIFDFDGVILNSHRIKTQAFYNIFKSYGKTTALRAQKFHLLNIGKSRYYKFKYILNTINNLPDKKDTIKELDKAFDYFVEKKIKYLFPSKYLLKFLKNNGKYYKLYISTATPKKKIIKILKDKKIFKYFNKIYGSPKTKRQHIRDIKKNKKKCIFIGDSLEDLKVAKFSNIPFILKVNSENLLLRNQKKINTMNSFKYLEKKIISLKEYL